MSWPQEAQGNVSAEELEAAALLMYHKQIYDSVAVAYAAVAWLLMSLGLIGHAIGVVILALAPSMQTAHFRFYKLMTLAELLYCATFFMSKILEISSSWRLEGIGTQVFTDGSAAYVYCSLARHFYSSTGYLVLYMAIFISADRFAALWCTRLYRQLNERRKDKMSKISCWSAIFAAAIVHSWPGLTTKVPVPIAYANVSGYECRDRTEPQSLIRAQMANSMLNMAVRLCYPPLLLLLTAGVVYGFVQYKNRRASLSLAIYDHRRRSERRKEKNLYCLMAVVVVLAFLQVVPVEVKRYIGWLRPPGSSRSLTEPINWVLLWLTAGANLATWVDRSLKFYLYMLFNCHFRRESLRVFFGARFDTLNAEMSTVRPTRAFCSAVGTDISSPNPFDKSRCLSIGRSTARGGRLIGQQADTQLALLQTSVAL